MRIDFAQVPAATRRDRARDRVIAPFDIRRRSNGDHAPLVQTRFCFRHVVAPIARVPVFRGKTTRTHDAADECESANTCACDAR
jgi:hypothetical protein